MDKEGFVPLEFERLAQDEQMRRVREYHDRMATRRSVREFSPEPVPPELVEWAIRAAGRAPSGANLQPWRFVVITDAGTKRRVREAAEAEEKANYDRRFPAEWKEALGPLGTDWRKEFLEIAPCLIVVFAIIHGGPQPGGMPGEARKHYYVAESVGIACGFLLSALHLAGLATLTHTPSPMGFLARLLARPSNERAYLLIPVGYPAVGATVPILAKKPLEEILTRSGGAAPGEAD